MAQDQVDKWLQFGRWPDVEYFPTKLGLSVEELRTDYTRMLMPFDPTHLQPAGVVHGGAIASLIDSVVVPSIAGAYPDGARMATIEMHVQYLGALTGDAVAEGWIVRRGRSVVFTRAEVFDESHQMVASGTATYRVSPNT